MKVSQLKQSRFLTKEDVTPPIRRTISHVDEEDVAQEGEPEKKRFVLYLRDEPSGKGLVLNVTNGMAIEDITGSDDSDDWSGTVIELYNDKSVTFAGQRQGGIRIRSVQQPARKQKKPADPFGLDAANRELAAAANDPY